MFWFSFLSTVANTPTFLEWDFKFVDVKIKFSFSLEIGQNWRIAAQHPQLPQQLPHLSKRPQQQQRLLFCLRDGPFWRDGILGTLKDAVRSGYNYVRRHSGLDDHPTDTWHRHVHSTIRHSCHVWRRRRQRPPSVPMLRLATVITRFCLDGWVATTPAQRSYVPQIRARVLRHIKLRQFAFTTIICEWLEVLSDSKILPIDVI